MTTDAGFSLSTADVEQLCRAAAGGDAPAIERLLALYQRRFAGYVARKIGAELRGKLAAEDVLQEAYVLVFGQIKHCTYEHADSFYRWVLFLIDRVLIDRVRHLRRKKRDAAREATPARPSDSRHDDLLERCWRDTTTPSRITRRAEALSALMAAIAQLPERDRAVVRRLYLDQAPVSAIAAELQCTENWVRKLGLRVVERLKRKLRVSHYLTRD